MTAVLVSDVLDSVSADLFDPNRQRWTLADLLDMFNRARREVFKRDHFCNIGLSNITTVIGQSRYPIMSGATFEHYLQQVVGLRRLDERTLVAEDPNWENSTPDTPEGYVQKTGDDFNLYLYPPPDSITTVKTFVGYLDVDVQVTNIAIGIDSKYAPALYYYIMGAAYLREGHGQNIEKANAYIQEFEKAFPNATK